MKLWTIQRAEAWQVLQAQGVLYGERRFVDPYFWSGYEWLCEQMEQRLGPRPHADAFPMWAWYQYDGEGRKKPDLRSRRHFPRGTSGVLMEIELADEAVLLSDFDLWHYPLNYWYLAGEEESARFDAQLATLGLDWTELKPMEPLPDPLFHGRMVASWQRIFDLDWVDAWVQDKTREQKCIQATFWALHRHQVSKIRLFLAR